jgi:hypothetical protein
MTFDFGNGSWVSGNGGCSCDYDSCV